VLRGPRVIRLARTLGCAAWQTTSSNAMRKFRAPPS
jgi:hypothetical protein